MILLQNVTGVKTLRWYWQRCLDLLTHPFTPPPHQCTWSWAWSSCWWCWRPSASCSSSSSWGRCSTWRRRSHRTAWPFWSTTTCPSPPCPRGPWAKTRATISSAPPLWSPPATTAWPTRTPPPSRGGNNVKRRAERVSTSGNPNISNFSRQTSWDSSIQQAVSF